jgi:protocatechuate 3,4-dioxygenase beta subunit
MELAPWDTFHFSFFIACFSFFIHSPEHPRGGTVSLAQPYGKMLATKRFTSKGPPMEKRPSYFSRRGFLNRLAIGGAALGASAFMAPGAFAAELVRTPEQTEGPFYPDKLPLDTDNDLLIVNDSITQAVGEITHLSGRILDAKGDPIRNAVVEIWQVDNNAIYLHSRGGSREKRDANFQGYGRFLTSSTGEYYFRTIKPVPYPGRTPHIHFAVKTRGRQEKFTTQCYVKGHPNNARDGVLRGIHDAKQKESVLIDFAAVPGSKIGELAAKFEIVMGYTPEV